MYTISRVSFGAAAVLCALLIGLSSCARALTTAESMQQALAGNKTAVFQIGNDFTFSWAAGSKTSGSDGYLAPSDKLTPKLAGAYISVPYANMIIRVSGGRVMVDSAGQQCTLRLLPNNGGIGFSMQHGGMMDTTQTSLSGVIKGNRLTADSQYSMHTLINHVGNGVVATGNLTVSITPLPAEQWPPLPPISVSTEERNDHAIIVQWQDPNPPGTIASYEIYRCNGCSLESVKLGSVNTCGCIDTSDTAKTETLILTYYIIARAKNGKVSCMSEVAGVDPQIMVNRVLNRY